MLIRSQVCVFDTRWQAEEDRIDQNIVGKEAQGAEIDHGSTRSSAGIAFDEDLNVPWISLFTDRTYRDELASLHFFWHRSSLRATAGNGTEMIGVSS